jgi:hypothetical protein
MPMNRRKLVRAVKTAALSAAVLGAVSIPSASAATAKKIDELTKDGYKCEVVATGWRECTKKDGPTYWCDDSGDCQPKPKVVVTPDPVRGGPIGPAKPVVGTGPTNPGPFPVGPVSPTP